MDFFCVFALDSGQKLEGDSLGSVVQTVISTNNGLNILNAFTLRSDCDREI